MSSNLEAKLREALTASMKARDTKTTNVIKMITTKIMERRTAAAPKNAPEDFKWVVDDAMVLDVLNTYKKQMEKARTDYIAAGDRGKELLAEADFEISWCAKWLPEGMSEAELREAVTKAVNELPVKDPKMAGKIIGAIKKQFGDRADAQLAKKLADELLKS
ncbi:MAG: GatB/YqeY domain-containing protein [Proteobacteria bacterium]|nr:GatB/YqeY domain-containing protein [Pseudomonadota bacterium]